MKDQNVQYIYVFNAILNLYPLIVGLQESNSGLQKNNILLYYNILDRGIIY